MQLTRTCLSAAFAVACCVLSSTALGASDEGLAHAKELYRSAAYEDALTVLDGLKGAPSSSEATEVAEYRLFCLVALDRHADARKAIESIVTADPFYQPSDSQASPRILTVFRDVRRSLLPSIVQLSYADAKASFDRKDPETATRFDRLLTLLDDPDVRTVPALADLRTVATGFRDLSRAVTTAPAAVPTVAPTRSSAQAAPDSTSPGTEHAAGVIVTPPVALVQSLPPWTPIRGSIAQIAREFSGTLDVKIDEHGDVVSATIVKSIHPSYDADLLKAARSWRFKPATRNGVPVPSAKTIEVRLKPSS
jgi:TonB family protein